MSERFERSTATRECFDQLLKRRTSVYISDNRPRTSLWEDKQVADMLSHRGLPIATIARRSWCPTATADSISKQGCQPDSRDSMAASTRYRGHSQSSLTLSHYVPTSSRSEAC